MYALTRTPTKIRNPRGFEQKRDKKNMHLVTNVYTYALTRTPTKIRNPRGFEQKRAKNIVRNTY